MRLKLDPWPAEFDSPLAIEEGAGVARQVDSTVERTEWAAVPSSSAGAACCAFVDGVRRVEARVLGDKDGALVGEWYFGRPRGPIEAMSATKSVVNLAIGRLIHTGILPASVSAHS